MKPCPGCGHQVPEIGRFCTRCGKALEDRRPSPVEEMNLPVLYVMVGLLLLAIFFPPWETPPAQPPEFLGFSFLFTPPAADARVSRLLLTVEVVTIAIGGVYFSWLFRKKQD